ncbi:MAG: RluA family pseudouridine synthase [Rhizobacter sp.]|nr:RluA family pseudouridine synthase [Rhizobacter sp.]
MLSEQEEDDTPERRSSSAGASLHGMRLDKVLVTMADEFSRNHLQHLIESGHVWVDGVMATSASRKVMAGQHVEVELVPTAESRAFRAEAMTLPIVFEDDHLMVVDKPAGLVVHPAAGNWSGTLLNGVLAHHAAAAALPRAGIVHRLDKDTSGLMVVGKTLPAVTALARAIAAREVHREYLALVHGRLAQSSLHIDLPLARDPQSRVRMAVVGQGKPAQTDVTRLFVAETADGPVTGVRCKLHTGRTHQIRVHLATRGHPLLADSLYGGRPALGLQRQALHAARLGFVHPHTGQPLSFEAPLPTDLAQAWQRVDAARGGP